MGRGRYGYRERGKRKRDADTWVIDKL